MRVHSFQIPVASLTRSNALVNSQLPSATSLTPDVAYPTVASAHAFIMKRSLTLQYIGQGYLGYIGSEIM